MSTPHRPMTALLGESLDRLAPLIEKAAATLERKGNSASKALKNKLVREMRTAQVIHRTLVTRGDDAPIWALAQGFIDFPKSSGWRGPGIQLVVDNTLVPPTRPYPQRTDGGAA